ncbi:MAG TPA: hypothetical protein VF545_06020 [Thermoleophilaceae bacterium]|jgi:hypothetical protein
MIDGEGSGQGAGDDPSDRSPADEGQGASDEDAREQAGTPGEEGQGGDAQDGEDQATGNPKNAGE